MKLEPRILHYNHTIEALYLLPLERKDLKCCW